MTSIDYHVLLKWQPHAFAIMFDRMDMVYTNLKVSIGTFLLGVVDGYLLYMYETGKIKDWPVWFRKYALKVALLLIANSYFGSIILSSPYIAQLLPSPDDLKSETITILMPTFKMITEISMSVTLLLLATGGGYKFVRDILSGRTFRILSHLSFAVFMIHMDLIYMLPIHESDIDYRVLWGNAVFYIVVSYICACIIHVVYEMPINNVVRYIMKRAKGLIAV